MDVVKVFIEEPVGLEALVPDGEPDARRRSAERGSLEAFLVRRAAPDYARAYLAGTHLTSGGRPRVGLTALSDSDPWLQPLLDWAGARMWTRVEADGCVSTVAVAEAADTLRQPKGARALGVGPVPPGALVDTARAANLRDALPALRALLDADPAAAVLYSEPAHDGWDWSVFARRPLAGPLAEAFGRHPAPVGTRRFVAPYGRARGEHSFYFEQWALDALPEWVDEV